MIKQHQQLSNTKYIALTSPKSKVMTHSFESSNLVSQHDSQTLILFRLKDDANANKPLFLNTNHGLFRLSY